MAELGSELDLAQKTVRPQCLRERGLQDLDRYQAIVLQVAGAVDDGHPAFAYLLLDGVTTAQGGGEAVPLGYVHALQSVDPVRERQRRQVTPLARRVALGGYRGPPEDSHVRCFPSSRTALALAPRRRRHGGARANRGARPIRRDRGVDP